MRFRILGPLEVFDGTSWTGVAAAKPRTLLAVLLLNNAKPVGIDRLVEEVWGEHAPRTATNLIQQYVMRLRRTIHDPRGEVLVTRTSGYQVQLVTEDLDAARFAHLETAGLSALEAGEAERASALLAEALSLWRGRPLSDVPLTPTMHAEAARMEEQRSTILEARVEADLARGAHDTVIPELRKLVIDHPLRERLRAQLMLALYRSGRQGEALAAYREIHRLLDTELGVEPASALQRLHQRILRADPTLDRPATDTEQTGPERLPPVFKPAQLPLSIAGFIGRRAELSRLDAIAASTVSQPTAVVICALWGMAGIGKSTLAVHWARRVRARFPDGQLYVDLRGFDSSGSPMSSAEALRGFLDALGVTPQMVPTGVAAQAALYRSLIADKRLLVLLDNARDAEQVRPLLPGAPGCMVVITSRNQMPGLVATEGAHPFALELLSVQESRELIAVRVGAERVADEAAVVDQIVDRCARLPLALAIAAAQAATYPEAPLASLAKELRGSLTELDALDAGDPASNLRGVFSWSYHTLNEPAARLFRLLGLHPGPDIAVSAAASLTGQSIERTRPLLAELSRAHLISQHSPGRYSLHDLLRTYARGLVDSVESTRDRDAALSRLFGHYTSTADNAADLLRPGRPPIVSAHPAHGATTAEFAHLDDAIAWFTAEHLVLVALARDAAARGFNDHAWQLAWNLRDFLDRKRLWHEQIAVQRTGLDAARRLGDKSAQAYAHRSLGRVCGELEDNDDAAEHYEHALELFRELGDHLGQAQIHMSIGMLRQRQKRKTESLHHHHQALALYELAGDTAGRANAHNNIAMNHLELDDREQALIHGTEALNLIQEIDDRFAQAATWDSLGGIHAALGQHAQAIGYYHKSLDLVRQVGDRYHEALSLEHLADVHRAMGDAAAMTTALRQAFDILNDLDHPDATRVRVRLEQRDGSSGEPPPRTP